MKKMIAENKGKLIFSSAVILFPQAVAFFMKESIYYLPFQCFVIHWICLLITFADWRKKPQGKKVFNLVFGIMPVLSIAGSAFILFVKNGQISYALALVFMYLGFGLMFILIGNYLPKIRQNRTMGIKIKWALEDEENWNATHRFGGKVWVVCGFICMMCALLPFSGFGVGIFITSTIAAVMVPTVYSWNYYQKRLQAGEVSKIKTSRRSILVTGILITATAVFIIWTLFSGNMTISYQDDGLVIHASGWEDCEIRYADIENISFEPEGTGDGGNDRRTNGFGNLKMSMGEFYNDRFGDYIRYTFHDCQSCVVLQVKGETMVINGQDQASTEEIYNMLTGKCGEEIIEK